MSQPGPPVVEGTYYGCIRPTSAGPPGADWVEVTVQYWDYVDGPGLRARNGAKVQGPYIAPDRIKIGGSMELLDREGNPILYFPAATNRPNIYAAGGYVNQGSKASLYDVNDNIEAFRRTGETDAIVLKRVQIMLGDLNANGYIDSRETAVTTAPFLLWTAGPDGLFGISDLSVTNFNSQLSKCDDVTNFK